jgi:hypothetical protein
MSSPPSGLNRIGAIANEHQRRRDRRGRTDPGGTWPPREGLLPPDAPGRSARSRLSCHRRTKRDRSWSGRARDRGMCESVWAPGAPHRPQRLASGRLPDRNVRHDDRPSVRFGPAGRELRSGPDRCGRARRRDRRGGGAHGLGVVRRLQSDAGGVRGRLLARSPGAAQHRRAGPRRGDDRGVV